MKERNVKRLAASLKSDADVLRLSQVLNYDPVQLRIDIQDLNDYVFAAPSSVEEVDAAALYDIIAEAKAKGYSQTHELIAYAYLKRPR